MKIRTNSARTTQRTTFAEIRRDFSRSTRYSSVTESTVAAHRLKMSDASSDTGGWAGSSGRVLRTVDD
jgi:hypothetical protein